MALYLKNKDGVMWKVAGGGGISEIPVATENVLGGIKSSTNKGFINVDESTALATVNDNVTMDGSGEIVLEGDFGNGPYVITIDKNPPLSNGIGYDNTKSGINAHTVQDAIDVNAENIESIQNKTSYYSNTNLLDNWYFGNPINQKGQTTYSNTGYTIDRWVISVNAKVDLVDNGIKFSTTASGNSILQQSIPIYQNVLGKYITISIFTSNSICYYGTYTIPKIASGFDFPPISINNSFVMNLYANSSNLNNIIFRIYSRLSSQENDSIEIKAVKLELGTQQTLAHQDSDGSWILNDAPPNYQQELSKCQRYFYRLGLGRFRLTNTIVSAKRAFFMIPLPVPLFKSPSINCVDTNNYTNGWIRGINNNSIYKLDVLTYAVASYSTNNNYINIYFVMPDILDDAQLLVDGYIDFDANI